MEKNKIFFKNDKSVAGTVTVLGIIIILLGSTFSAAIIQKSETNIPQVTGKLEITWVATINFNEPGGRTDTVKFGEAPDAHDGPPDDSYDVAKPPAPMPSYIRTYLKDYNLIYPYDKMWEDYRQYPDSNKVWNLSVQWYPTDESSPTTITMSWSTAQVHNSEYTTVNLCTITGTVLKNMLVDSSYTFSCLALTTQNFKINCSSATVNEPPVVSDIPSQTIAEGNTFATINLDDYVTDLDNTDAEITWTYSGNVDLTVSIDSSRVATITIPNAEWNGAETITFKATDPGSLFSSDAAVFTVTAVDDPPVVSDIPDQVINEGSSFATINLDDYVSDVDNTDAEMTWTYSGNSQLTVSIDSSRVATITIPNENWYGAETITFKATDPGALWDDDAAVFTVTAENDAPVVSGIPDQTIAEGSSFATISLDDFVTDVDNTDAQMTWSYSGNVALTVSIDVNRVATITIPSLDWNGAETITFKATDPGALWDDDAAVFTVTAVDDPPVVSDIPDQVINEGSSFATINLDDYVSDVDNTDAEMTWSYSGNSQLSVSIDSSRVATITLPNENWYGAETITFKATDPGALWDDAAATFTVIAVNDPPMFGIPSPANGSTGNPLSFTWSIPINDPEGNVFSWSVQCSNGQTNNGTGASNGTKSVSLSGLAYSKTYMIWVNATDPTPAGSDLHTRSWYTFTTKANNPPVFGTPSPMNASTGNPWSLTWSIPITDPEGNAFSWTIQCSNGQTNSGTSATNGTKTLALSGLAFSTTYKVWVNATDPTGSNQWTRQWYTFTTQQQQQNLPPNKPDKPSGPSSGNINTAYTYTTKTTDPNGDPVYYKWDWGDGSQSNWLGPSTSGQQAQANHKWTAKGIYAIKVKAKDTKNAESNWSNILTVTILQKVFFSGWISNLDKSGDFITFRPVLVFAVWYSPTSFTIYSQGQMIISKSYSGFLDNHYIYGSFNAAPIKVINSVRFPFSYTRGAERRNIFSNLRGQN